MMFSLMFAELHETVFYCHRPPGGKWLEGERGKKREILLAQDSQPHSRIFVSGDKENP